jgi:hypothetical protein
MLHRDRTTIFSVQRSRASTAQRSSAAALVISICTFSPESAPSLLAHWSDLFFSSSSDALDSRDLMYSLALIRIDVLSFCRKKTKKQNVVLRQKQLTHDQEHESATHMSEN